MNRSRGMTRRLLTAMVCLSAGALALAPAVASADTPACAGVTVDDGAGGAWTLGADGNLEVVVTQTPAVASDAYDHFGRLFVDGNLYTAGAGVCDRTVSGGQRGTVVRYPEVALSGLQVRRSVALLGIDLGNTNPDVHIASTTSILRNATGAPVTVAVRVGEDASSQTDDLGSDATTTVLATSSGDTTVGATDDWAITADGPANGSSATDPVLLHAWGAPFPGQDRPESYGQSPGNPDNWRTGWNNVTVPPNSTVSYTTIESPMLASDNALQVPLALLQSIAANGLLTPSYYFLGSTLTVPEIAGSRNTLIPHPAVPALAPDRAAVGEDVQLVLAGTAGDNVAQCAPIPTATASYDGQVVFNANGRTTAAAGAPGSHPWSASATNVCGQTTTASGSVVVDGARTACARGFGGGSGAPLLDVTGAGYDPSVDGALTDGGFFDDGIISPAISDSYDSLHRLFVDGTLYNPPSVCTLEAGGRLIRTGEKDMSGLQVSRSTYVASGGAGARLAFTLTNPTAAPITVPVRLGSNSSEGGLGSDAQTVVVATGDGAATPTPASRWMVTDDAAGASDPALAHVWDGAGGLDQADTVTFDNPNTVAVDKDAYGLTYDAVTVAPGQSATYLIWEAQRRRIPQATGERDDAVSAAQTLSGLTGSDLYGGMSAAEITSVRNWARPLATGTLSGPASGTVGQAQTFTISGVAGGAGTPQCGAGTVAWTVDGAPVAVGASITRTFATADSHSVTATVGGDCGTAPLVRTASFSAVAATVPPPVKLSGLKVTGGCLAAPKKKATLKVSAAVTGATRITLKIQKLAKTAKTCLKPTSKAGAKLLKSKAATAVLTRTGKVAKGKVSFVVPVATVRSGKAKLVKGRLTLPRGAYRVTLTTGGKTVVGLVVVR